MTVPPRITPQASYCGVNVRIPRPEWRRRTKKDGHQGHTRQKGGLEPVHSFSFFIHSFIHSLTRPFIQKAPGAGHRLCPTELTVSGREGDLRSDESDRRGSCGSGVQGRALCQARGGGRRGWQGPAWQGQNQSHRAKPEENSPVAGSRRSPPGLRIPRYRSGGLMHVA